MSYFGPTQVVLVNPVSPSAPTAAANATFDNNDGSIVSAYVSGPYEYQNETRIALLGGSYGPPPPDPCPNPIPSIPTAADPPFPPVLPYLFSTDLLYGRDSVGDAIKMVRLDTVEIDFVAIEDNNGNALDLTSAVLTMTARYETTSTGVVFQLTSPSNGIVITDATAGEFTVTIPSVATILVPLIRTVLFFDIQASFGGPIPTVRKTLNRGQLIVLPDITTG
jgi:hypothetical protein